MIDPSRKPDMHSKPFLFSVLSMICATACAAPQLDANVREMIASRVDNGELSSVVIGIIDGDDSAVYGFGKVGAAAPDAHTVYEIGSVTKTFTALLLAKAVQNKTLTLDEAVADLLPGYTLPKYQGKPITLLDLATQSSGLPRLPSNMLPKQPANPYADYGAAELKTFLADYTLPRAPGASYEYSNLGFGLLGYAMSAQAGRPYADLVREQISVPLGMESTGATLTPTMQARLAPGHDAAGTPVANWDMDALSGAGALRSDAQDLIRYLQTLMRQRSGDSAYALVQTPQRSTSMRDGRIGLAWHLNPLRATPIVWHNGMTGGYASYVGYTADGKRGVVVLTNTAASVDAIAMASLVPGAPPERKAVPLAAEVLADYDGRYQLAPGFILSVHPSARGLTTQATGQQTIAAYASARDEFFLREVDAQLSFQRDATGAVQSLTLHQHGRDMPAKKLPPAPPRASVTLAPAMLRGYVGTYMLSVGMAATVTFENGALYGQATGQPRFQLEASAPDEVYSDAAGIEVSFRRDAQGKVTRLLLRQAGQEIGGSRIADK